MGANDQVAHARHRTDAANVQHGHHADGCHHEDPGWDLGKGDIEEQADHQVVDHRQKQVIEQQRPAGQKADARPKAQAGVGIGRTGNRIFLHHGAVGQRGEKHRQQGDDVRGGRAPAGELGDHAVGGKNGQRHHVHQAEEHQGRQVQDASQGGALGAVGKFAGDAAGADGEGVAAGGGAGAGHVRFSRVRSCSNAPASGSAFLPCTRILAAGLRLHNCVCGQKGIKAANLPGL